MFKQVYCQKCHKLAAQVEKNEEGTRIMQGGKTLISLGGKSKINMGGDNKIMIVCSSGHKVKVEV